MIGLKLVHFSKLKAQQLATESRVSQDLKRISNGKDSAVLLKAELERLEEEERSATARAHHSEIEMIAHSTDAELLSLSSIRNDSLFQTDGLTRFRIFTLSIQHSIQCSAMHSQRSGCLRLISTTTFDNLINHMAFHQLKVA